GLDNVVDVERLAKMTADGELRFVLGGPQLQGQKPEIAAWLAENCTIVPPPAGSAAANSQALIQTLPPVYDCAG
ncbi:MAG: hypothetical protein Q8P50_11975, partial [Bacillota bacterium]|nr:hypothetical protein [Bacillota bacterium]